MSRLHTEEHLVVKTLQWVLLIKLSWDRAQRPTTDTQAFWSVLWRFHLQTSSFLFSFVSAVLVCKQKISSPNLIFFLYPYFLLHF